MIVRRSVLALTAAVGCATLVVPVPVHADPAPATRALYVTNSATDNLTIFTMDPAGMLSRRPELIPTGDVPGAVVLSPDGRRVYVANTAPGTDIGAISSYAVGSDGGLEARVDVEIGAAIPFGLAMSPDGRALYVSNIEPGTVSTLAVDAGGRLTPLGPPVPTGSPSPRGIAVTPDGRFLFVAHRTLPDGQPARLGGFAVRSDRTLEPLTATMPTCADGFGMAITPNGRFLYVVCFGTDEVAGFGIGVDGALTPVPGMRFPVGDMPEGVAITPDGRNLYVSNLGPVGQQSDQPITAVAIAADGSLNPVPGPPALAGRQPAGITTTPDGRHVYVSNFGSHTVSGFRIADGRLNSVPGSPLATGGATPIFQAIAVTPNQAPRAAFSVDTAPAGRATRFDATTSADRDGRIDRYHWDFGDGTGNPDGGPIPTHVYRRPGTFVITLTVTDNEGCSTVRIYTGQKHLCNGGPAARLRQIVTID